MISINQVTFYSTDDVLFVFALAIEAGKTFDQYTTLFTGIGKVNASYELTKAIQVKKPKLIINLGSAGSNHFSKGDVVCCTQFVQRDMDVRGLGYALYETPFADVPIILPYGLEKQGVRVGTCGTGDSFDTSHATTQYNVVDMEAYALALIAKKEDIPFLCLKYISDGADDNAADDWTVLVHKAAVAFAEILELK
ncbi:5'-methylthioadenosine/S-adenosylhomocysteine nucleosidase family protein [Flavobacterium algicola]|uniref:5'-methylthioadenosine/S-adenosylhomocysteine nucleosidase family protein n=1 Tax=Flavobacterium algicola TaxID=556529 RepID=UPI001EFD345C|nr:nucleosidase [Flavobacterium algicola]MCG9792458.1 nucleosidase [Flavobacterium algicola]